ncbi:hypothetical protein CEXT_649851 [Caerostris extrusa]|uniref:Uncharacterized protein n=1 Tax=Caerostris extrusa TaxID=172846 RepID=A0AAV4MJK3_CAEEX|nr:hypothetical protein CEXT_649851 [Caerostris extrusa]
MCPLPEAQVLQCWIKCVYCCECLTFYRFRFRKNPYRLLQKNTSKEGHGVSFFYIKGGDRIYIKRLLEVVTSRGKKITARKQKLQDEEKKVNEKKEREDAKGRRRTESKNKIGRYFPVSSPVR